MAATDADDNDYARRTAGQAVAVRSLARPLGKGTFATAAAAYGSTVWTERPIVWSRFLGEPDEGITACAHCLRTVLRPAQLAAFPGAFELLAERFPQPEPVRCAGGCSAVCPLEVYCSAACRDAAWTQYHAVVCPGAGPDAAAHPLALLYGLCSRLRRTNPMMVARTLATVQQQLEATPLATADDCFRPFAAFAAHAADRPGDEEAFALIARLFGDRPRLASLVTLDQYRRLNGAMLQNAQTIHPISDLHRLLETRDAHLLARALACFGLRIPQLQQLRESPLLQGLTASGTGMFPVANCTNHSCSPNVVSMTRRTDLTLELVAVQALAPGDELFISYIDETRPWRERQALLARGYQFQCHCARCAADEAAARAPAADLARYRAGDV